jgi:hypothetical protein
MADCSEQKAPPPLSSEKAEKSEKAEQARVDACAAAAWDEVLRGLETPPVR